MGLCERGLHVRVRGELDRLHLFSSACQGVQVKSDSHLPSSSDSLLGMEAAGAVEVCAQGGGEQRSWDLSWSVNHGRTGGFLGGSDEVETDSGRLWEGSSQQVSLQSF